MKRFFTFLIFAIFTISTVFAQSFEVYDHEDNLINGETITVPTTIGGPELYYYFTVKNTSGSQKTVKIGIELQTTQIDGSYHSICSPTTNNSTGQCGMPWGSTSAQFILDPSETSGDGDFRFTQGPNGGITTILYTVYDINNVSDNITFTISYSTLTSDNLMGLNEFAVYPNPAVNSFVVSNDFGPNSYVEIYNVLGMQVSRVDFSSNGETEIDCSNWEKGYYFCRLYNNGQIEKTIKLTITH